VQCDVGVINDDQLQHGSSRAKMASGYNFIPNHGLVHSSETLQDIRMQALQGLAAGADVQALLESMILPDGATAGTRPTKQENVEQLLLVAFAHIPFFANLPIEVRELCSAEPFQVVQIRAPHNTEYAVVYRQGAKVEGGSGLYVILDGQVAMLSLSNAQSGSTKSVDSDLLGPNIVRLGAGDAFGDEVLIQRDTNDVEHSSAAGPNRSLQRCTSAVVPSSAFCILLTSPRVLQAIANFLVQQSSAFYFLHPMLCLKALRTQGARRIPAQVAQVAQCVDALSVFSSPLGQEIGHLFSSTVEVVEVLPGQPVFQEYHPIDGCYVVLHGQVLLSEAGARPSPSLPVNPCPHLGNAVGELGDGDVIIDPAPFYHGLWPCSAVALTKASVLYIPETTHHCMRKAGLAFASRQFEQVLSKPQSRRSRLDNQRVAQFLSSFSSMKGVPMDKRVELANLMSFDTYYPEKHLVVCAGQELIILSGSALVLEEDRTGQGNAATEPMGGMVSPMTALRLLDDTLQRELQQSHVRDPCSPGSEGRFQHAARRPNTLPSGKHLAQTFAEQMGSSISIIVALNMEQDLEDFLEEIADAEDQDEAEALCVLLRDSISPFLSHFDAQRLEVALYQFSKRVQSEKQKRSPEVVVRSGDVIGWHVFPCKNRQEDSRFIPLTRMAVAVLAHSEIDVQRPLSGIFKRSSVYIPPQKQVDLVKALLSKPPDRHPEQTATLVMGLQSILPLAFLHKLHPMVFKEICEHMVLLAVGPGETIREAGQNVEEVFVVLQGSTECHVAVNEQDFDHVRRFWLPSGATSLKVVQTRNSQHEWPAVLSAHMCECIAVHGPGDFVGFADMVGGTWFSSLRASHQGCALAAIPSRMLESHSDTILTIMRSTASPSSCIEVLQVPRPLCTEEQLMLLHMLLSSTPSFIGLSEDFVAKLCAKACYKHFCADQVLLSQSFLTCFVIS
jgi:CRP-like cAMP-binding protein